jgi:hypothetical protein
VLLLAHASALVFNPVERPVLLLEGKQVEMSKKDTMTTVLFIFSIMFYL